MGPIEAGADGDVSGQGSLDGLGSNSIDINGIEKPLRGNNIERRSKDRIRSIGKVNAVENNKDAIGVGVDRGGEVGGVDVDEILWLEYP